jgi:hypothetical protein
MSGFAAAGGRVTFLSTVTYFEEWLEFKVGAVLSLRSGLLGLLGAPPHAAKNKMSITASKMHGWVFIRFLSLRLSVWLSISMQNQLPQDRHKLL